MGDTRAVKSEDFDGVFLPGGKGPMLFDLSEDSDLIRLLSEFDREGKIISAVCHGLAAFINAKKPKRSYSISARDAACRFHRRRCQS